MEALDRMRSLLQRWQQSLDLHIRYLELDDAHYWHVQPWPKHERPAAWIVRLARDKVQQLSRQLEAQAGRGDKQLAVALENMAFLANLVGLQPAERHIPLADKDNERAEALGSKSTAETTSRRSALRATAETDRTREMPRPKSVRAMRTTASERNAGAVPAPTAAERPIIDDAVRLLQWGRQWHELGELISRLAERPPLGDVRRVLRTHRARIERQAAADSS